MIRTRDDIAQAFDRYDLPPYMAEPLAEYLFDRAHLPGRFLAAVLANHLVQAFGAADDANTRAMRGWASLLYNELPGNAWGSPDAVRDWIANSGTRAAGRDTERTEEGL